MSAAGRGVWLGVDVGTVRVGVARSDPHGVLATPVATVQRRGGTGADLDELVALVTDHEAVGVVIGLPRTLRGREGASVQMAREYGELLAARIAPVPVTYVDERLTTVAANRRLTESGVRGARSRRAFIDQAAAVELLQNWLDSRR